MNILYDYSIFHLQRYGGISRYFYELINRISLNKEASINVFEGFHINEYGLSGNKNNFNLYKGYKIPYIKYIYNVVKLDPIWFRMTYSHMGNLDIFHPTYYREDLDKFRNSAVVITVHDMIHELYKDQFSKYDPTTKYKRLSVNAADAIICVSENTKKDIIRIYNVPEEKIWVVYHGSSLNKIKSLDMDKFTKENSLKKPYLLYVGNRDGYKNFSLLMNVYAAHFADDFNLLCFGGGNFKETELILLTKYNLLDKVIHVNGSDDFLAALYKKAFCLIYPSLYEGFGIPPLEAMSLGCPVIASNTSSIPEVVGNGGILFDPLSEEDLTRSIDSLMNHRSRSRLILKGFQQEKKFSWDKTASETFNVYKSIIS
ncbi:mannosyltransferase [Methanosarcina mazei Go1]|uniref:Mannosyltransferase n=1 Tax=Methanosarcina mazei (strain ATCC BAA-159 / DSM 3647 / Goe1 / Go1 / JCM 11833 / OCM 88) TaxID=192952 RepID=Q8PZ40_METMA|nr:glycosyltransferase family 1 protein [Methanosarcina mazei]AAM30350.1 mannosyltransferase [Methanosarcina mazei Go1]WIM47372.1 glycosyltransferase family 1 protein [Methanosarcina mazei]